MNLEKLYFLKKLSLIILILWIFFPILSAGLLAGAFRSESERLFGFVIFVILLFLLILSLTVFL